MLTNTALGLIFPNAKDNVLPAITEKRTMASVPFAGRYRLIDFTLSSMTNAGIKKVGIIVKQNYLSLMAHVGAGREWDLARKHNGVTIFPPYTNGKMYEGRIGSIFNAIDYLEESKEEYVIMSECDMACNFDYDAIVENHIATNADISVVYQQELVTEMRTCQNPVFEIDENGRVTEVLVSDSKIGNRNISMNTYVISRKLLIELVRNAYSRNYTDFEIDILAKNLSLMRVIAFKYEGYCSRIQNMKAFYDANIALLNPDNIRKLFSKEFPVYTKVRDDAPVVYAIGCKVSNSIISDGCMIEGEVENSVLFRGVRVCKGAKIKNSVVMRDAVIEEGACLEFVVSDKDVTITHGKKVCGSENYPVFIDMGVKV